MGHSFGGITVLGALADCDHAAACVTLDPWVWPHSKDPAFGASSDQKTLVVMTERFKNAIKRDEKIDIFEWMKKF